jgi:hypothetical protein
MGLVSVLTPHVHFRRKTAPWQASPGWSPDRACHTTELCKFRDRWADILTSDPAYSALLNRDTFPYSGLRLPSRSNMPHFSTDPAIPNDSAVASPNDRKD